VNALVLGGTTFLGRHVARALLARGHAVSTFTRGRAQGEPDARIARYIGDRDGDLRTLPRGGWDAVIDTSAMRPSWIAASAAHLHRAKRYLFTSSVSVYDARAPETGEGRCPYQPMPAGATEGDDDAYGPFKRRCEDAALAVYGPERTVVVRPGLIVGPHDPTNRCTYWVDRGAAGGAILAPGSPGDFVQFIDVRDLADFMVRILEDERSGIYDVTGSPQTTTRADLIAACVANAAETPEVVWADDAWLETQGLSGWMDLPLWLGPSLGLPGLMNARVDRARADGLTFRPLAETVAATRAWSANAPAERERPAGITRTRERELLEALRLGSRL
jgi:2'-hydroxyisoflavone reductase